jgi:hypothetical protein
MIANLPKLKKPSKTTVAMVQRLYYTAKQIEDLVEGFFRGSYSETTRKYTPAQAAKLWMSLPNPLLGNVSPWQMLIMGRGAKVLKFVQQQLAANERGEHALRLHKSTNLR